jgi:hypothetical protein
MSLDAQIETLPLSPRVALNRALLAARKEIKPVVKRAHNKHFDTYYADIDACYEAINDALLNHGLLSEQWTEERQGVGTFLITQIRHAETDETTKPCELKLRINKEDMQNVGAAITYGRRFLILTALQLAPEDKDGNDATTKDPASRPVDDGQYATIQGLFNRLKIAEGDRAAIVSKLAGKHADDVTYADAVKIIKALSAKIEANKGAPTAAATKPAPAAKNGAAQ